MADFLFASFSFAEVILLSDKISRLRAEFNDKDVFLRSVGFQLSPIDFYDLLFSDLGDTGKIMAVAAGQKYFTVKKENIVDLIAGRDDIYFSTAQFWDNYKRDAFIDKIWAYVVDVDHVSPGALRALFVGLQRSGPMPTVITNSGHGIHLYYILDPPLSTYSATRRKASELYAVLNMIFEFKTDRHSIGHAFRAVGGLTKLGDVTSAFRVGDTWTNAELADAVDYEWVEPETAANRGTGATEKMVAYARFLAESAGVTEPDYTDFNDTYRFIKEQQGVRFSRSGLTASDLASDRVGMYSIAPPNAATAWYYKTKAKIMMRTEISHRYTSLMALAVIAYKCRIPEAELQRDIEDIADEWEVDPRWSQDPFNRKNVPDALRCYSQRFIKVRRETLEEWLGWEFSHKSPPARSQEEHLENVANQKRGRSLGLVMQALRDNPDANKTMISRMTGLSRPTVIKYYDAAKLMVGIK